MRFLIGSIAAMGYLVVLGSACQGEEVPLGGRSQVDSGSEGHDGGAGVSVTIEAGQSENPFPVADSPLITFPEVDPQLLAYDAGQSVVPASFWSSDAGACTAANLCAEPKTLLPMPPSVLAVEEMLLGDWAACTPPSYFSSGTVGLRIAADGTFHELALSGGALVEQGQGFTGHGTWDVIQDDTRYELGLRYPQGGSGFVVTFATNPREISLDPDEGPEIFVAAQCP